MPLFRIYDLDIEVPDHLLTPAITRGLEKGWYERDEVEIARSRLGRGDRVVELGAGLGVTALVAARLVGPENILAFEANPALGVIENNNAALNNLPVKFRNQVLVPRVRRPASGRVGFAPAEEFWASSLDPNGGLEVEALALEDVMEEFGANTLILDIEGAEIEIFETVNLDRINFIIVELHYERTGRVRADKAISRLLAQGFSIDFSLTHRSVLCLDRPSRSLAR